MEGSKSSTTESRYFFMCLLIFFLSLIAYRLNSEEEVKAKVPTGIINYWFRIHILFKTNINKYKQ